MAEKIKVKAKKSVLADLVFAQTCKLEKLKLASVSQAHCLSLDELRKNEMFDQIQPNKPQEIMEGITKRLQGELVEPKDSPKKHNKRLTGWERLSSQ